MITMLTILYIMALSIVLLNVDGKPTCLGAKEKNIIKTMRNNMKQLDYQITRLEESFKIGTSTVTKTGRCQKGWRRYRNHCYFFSSDKVVWLEAQRNCQKHGSTLAKIDDAAENTWISLKTQEMKLKDNNLLWLGGIYTKDGKWQWTADNSPFTYVNWMKGEPSDGGKNENCLSILNSHTYNSTWNDYSCNRKTLYLCKKQVGCGRDCNEKRIQT